MKEKEGKEKEGWQWKLLVAVKMEGGDKIVGT